MSGSSGFVWDWAFTIKMLPLLIKGAGMTVLIAACSITLGTCIGLVIALIKVVRNPILNYLGGLYTWVFRGIPFSTVIYHLLCLAGSYRYQFRSIPGGSFRYRYVWRCLYWEIIRAGIQSIDKGQMEAALSLGMSYSQAMRRIIIPKLTGV